MTIASASVSWALANRQSSRNMNIVTPITNICSMVLYFLCLSWLARNRPQAPRGAVDRRKRFPLSQVGCSLRTHHGERSQSSIFRSKIRSAYSEEPYGPFPATKACTKRQPSRALSMISLRQSSFGFPEKSPPWSFTQTNLYSYFSFTRLFQFLSCLTHPMRGGNPEFQQERYRLLHETPNGVHSCP